MRLVFSSINIAGSFSWFAVLILLKCKSGVNISPASLLFWFDEVGIFFNWNRRFFFLWFVVPHDFDFLIRGGITHDHHVLLPTILTFYFIDVCFITCSYTRFWLFWYVGVYTRVDSLFITLMFGSSRVVSHDGVCIFDNAVVLIVVFHLLLHQDWSVDL